MGKKGYEDWSCGICGKEDESINHRWMYKDARELIKDEWREGKIGEELSSRLLRQLQGGPVPALCEYLRRDYPLEFSKNRFFFFIIR